GWGGDTALCAGLSGDGRCGPASAQVWHGARHHRAQTRRATPHGATHGYPDVSGGRDSRRSHSQNTSSRVRVPGLGPGHAVEPRPPRGGAALRRAVAESLRRTPPPSSPAPCPPPPGVGRHSARWRRPAPAYLPDVVQDTNPPRPPIAAREGLHTAFGFPILLGSDVLGVMEFFSHERRPPDPDLFTIMATI